MSGAFRQVDRAFEQRLRLDFLSEGESLEALYKLPLLDLSTQSSFFSSSLFKERALGWLCGQILRRNLSVHDAAYRACISDPSKDLSHIICLLVSSDEYFVQQCGENLRFYRARVSNLLPGVEAGQPDEALRDWDGRLAGLLAQATTNSFRRHVILRIYDALGLANVVGRKLDTLLNKGGEAFFIEAVLTAATSEKDYGRHARRGFSSLDLLRRRMRQNLDCFVATSDLRARKSALCISNEIASGELTFCEAASKLTRHLIETFTPLAPAWAGLGLLIGGYGEALLPPRYLTDIACPKDGRLPRAEKDYEHLCLPLARKLVASWLDVLKTSALANGLTTEIWATRLYESDGIFETLADLLLSDAVFGPIRTCLFAHTNIDPPPGCFFDGASRPESYKRIVTTSFFHWYDDTDGKAFIACPDTMKNEEGEDSLTLRPANRDCFTFNSTQWHRAEINDMVEAGINVVIPVAYTTPFSSRPTSTHSTELEIRTGRFKFADTGLRVLRRTLREMSNDGIRPPRVAMFYDTSSLNCGNVFGLQVDCAKAYANDWFYESIRNFFSHFPADTWATFEGKPLLFVYHPSFAWRMNETVYPFVRESFRRDFGCDIYIVTAAEEEAPRVLQAARIADDVKSLQTEPGVETLVKILAQDDLFASVARSDEVYKTTILRRLLPESSRDQMLLKYGRQEMSSPEGRSIFLRDILSSEVYSTNLIDGWFRDLLRLSFDSRVDIHRKMAAEASRRLREERDWLGALAVFIVSDEFYAAAGGTDEYFVDWIYQSIAMKHVNPLCTPNYHPLYAEEPPKRQFLAALERGPREMAVLDFLRGHDVCEAIVSTWYYSYYGWYYPGKADTSFYWSAAISPCIRGVASIGPGYDQSKLRNRTTLFMPRQDGKTYSDAWDWILAMKPTPKIVHLETWNEFFEGTSICDTAEFGRTYIDLTRHYADRFLQEN